MVVAHSPGMLSLLDQYTAERVPGRLQCACRRSAPATGSVRKLGYGTDGVKRCSNCGTQIECSAAVRQWSVARGSSGASAANCAQSAGSKQTDRPTDLNSNYEHKFSSTKITKHQHSYSTLACCCNNCTLLCVSFC